MSHVAWPLHSAKSLHSGAVTAPHHHPGHAALHGRLRPASGSRPRASVDVRADSEHHDVNAAELEFRVLSNPAELEAVQRLRTEIQLPGSATADPEFATREKKETRTAWSVRSSGATHSSGR
jgi:hypothetical protein